LKISSKRRWCGHTARMEKSDVYEWTLEKPGGEEITQIRRRWC